MELTAGYQQTEVGVIPEDWDVLSLGSMVSDKAPIRYGVVQIGPNVADGVPIVPIKYVKQIGTSLLNRSSKAIEGRYPGSRILGSDVLISVKGTIGRVGIVPDGFEGNIAREIARIRLRSSIDPRYVAFQLESGQTQQRISESVVGTTRLEFSIAAVRSFLIALPRSSAEQRAIAAALSNADALIASLDALIAKKHDLKQATTQQYLTGEIRLPGFKDEWQRKTLGSMSAFITKGATPTTYGFGWQNDGVLFLRSECVSDRGLDLSQSMFISDDAHIVLKRGEVCSGDILITITGNVGRVIRLGDDFGIANINQHIARIRITSEQAHGDYVFHQLSRPEYIKYFNSIVTGQAYPQISLRQVRDAAVLMPTLDEQIAIAAILSDMDAELTALEDQRIKACWLKQGMMQELLTGRIRLV